MIFYTGSYTEKIGSPAPNPSGEGIGCFHFNNENGRIEELHYVRQRNPSYLAISKNKKVLYAIEEMYESLCPNLFAYKIGTSGELSLLNSQVLKGDYACHLGVVNNKVVLANYVSGNALSFSISKDGSLSPNFQLIQHEGVGPVTARQNGPHVHMVYPGTEDQLYLVDLGLDKAVAYKFNDRLKKWIPVPELDIEIGPGSGARHMIMNETGKCAYVLGEITGEVFVLKNNGLGYKQIQKSSIVPNNYGGEIGGAAIRLHPNGKYLYASNRGSDSIAVFNVDHFSNKLSLVAFESTGGKTPRDFNIDPSGKWLIVANQDSNSLVVFKINHDGTLKQASMITVETPVNITWL